jgi:TonB family protein
VRPQESVFLDPESNAPVAFELTLLDVPSLPVSLIRQAGNLLRDRREPSLHRDQPQARLPISDQQPWYRELPTRIRELLATPKAAPAGFASHVADVPDLWQDYPPNPYSWANSLLVHVLVLTALLLPMEFQRFFGDTQLSTRSIEIRDYAIPIPLTFPHLHVHDEKTGGGGGGGVRSPLPASRGALPPFALTQFTPPMVEIPKVAPILPMTPTLLGPPELKLPEMKLDMPWGDPKGVVGPPSGGPGTGGGIGPGDGTGVGPGTGQGYGPGSDGGCCGGPYSVGIGGVSAPIPIYSPEPAYSEEARKAKFGGIALLWIVVDAQGLVRSIKVAKPLGMGLDEEAVRTVRTWKFKPALRQGMAVPVQVQVEVNFRLF